MKQSKLLALILRRGLFIETTIFRFNDLIYLKCSVWTQLIRYAKHEFKNLKAQNSHAAY